MSSFAYVIKMLREERHMTQEEFADFLGTSKQNISRYERGEVVPKISTAFEIAKKLGVSLSYLNGNDESGDAPAEESSVRQQRERMDAIFSALSGADRDRLLDFAEILLRAQEAKDDPRK